MPCSYKGDDYEEGAEVCMNGMIMRCTRQNDGRFTWDAARECTAEHTHGDPLPDAGDAP